MDKFWFSNWFEFLRGNPVVYKPEIVVKYKNGEKKTERPGVAYRDESKMRAEAKDWCESRRNGSEKDKIEKVYFRKRLINII